MLLREVQQLTHTRLPVLRPEPTRLRHSHPVWLRYLSSPRLRVIIWVLMTGSICVVARNFRVVAASAPYSPARLIRKLMPPETCPTVRSRVQLLSIPHTAANITTAILLRYAIRNNLEVWFPARESAENQKKADRTDMESSYDILRKPAEIVINDGVYDADNLSQLLPLDTVYVSSVSHPLEHLRRILRDEVTNPKHHTVESFLKSLPSPERSHMPTMDNILARHFGLPLAASYSSTKIQQLVENIGRDFSVVIDEERLNESLVKLKRMLCWTLRDIIYDNRGRLGGVNTHHYSDRLEVKHRLWAKADFALYDYFSEKMNRFILRDTGGFLMEVQRFNHILMEVNLFCATASHKSAFYDISSSPFNRAFRFSRNECKLLQSRTVDLERLVRLRRGVHL